MEEGYLKIARASFASKKDSTGGRTDSRDQGQDPSGSGNDVPGNNDDMDMSCDEKLLAALQKLRKGSALPVSELFIKEGETTPPKRYNSGSMILAMENAGQLIEDEEPLKRHRDQRDQGGDTQKAGKDRIPESESENPDHHTDSPGGDGP